MGSTLDALGSSVTLLACVIAMGLTMLTAALALNIGRRNQEQQPVYRRWINTVSDSSLPAQAVLNDQFLRNGNRGIEDYTRYGAQGVSLTLRALVHSLGDGWFALTNVMISKSEDADIVVVGPSGVWVLESKYWSGYINIEQSKWSRVKVYYAPGGDRQTEYTRIRKAWDDQWLRQRDTIARSLRGTLTLPDGQSLRGMIDGGIILSYRKARLSADGSQKVAIGDISAWHNRMRQSELIMRLSFEDRLRVVDVLLSTSRQYQKGHIECRQAAPLAGQIFEGLLRRYQGSSGKLGAQR